MNDFPVWWDSTITVFNKHTDPITKIVKWYKTVIPNCFWKNSGDKVNIGGTVLDTSNVIARVPKQETFMLPGDWHKLPNDSMGDYFTLQLGDIVILGETDDVIDEYVSGKRSTDILAKARQFGECMEVKKVQINTMTGMLNPYYFIKGV